MIQNYRDLASSQNISTKHLSNEQLYNIIDSCGVMPTDEEQEQAVLEEIKLTLPNTSQSKTL